MYMNGGESLNLLYGIFWVVTLNVLKVVEVRDFFIFLKILDLGSGIQIMVMSRPRAMIPAKIPKI
jgi:hypothetical protein